MFLIQVNGLEYVLTKKYSILEACKILGFNIPRFCYHESLSLSGNCRMCLVEVLGLEKPVASCITEIENGMKIWLNTVFVKKARENVLEALLLNHPLDCPICDQAGECDLQDQTLVFGINASKNFFSKTVVEDKYCGPLIKTIMTRCIHCTRCVRFSTELAGNDFYGTTLRGGSTEITSYINKVFTSEVSGNVIDLCPVGSKSIGLIKIAGTRSKFLNRNLQLSRLVFSVFLYTQINFLFFKNFKVFVGALTSKVHAYKVRPWELKVFASIDVTDGVGSNVYINYKNNNIIRVLPRQNDKINEIFISDKARFFFDGLKKSRSTTYLTNKNATFWFNFKTFYKTNIVKNFQEDKNNSRLLNSSLKLLLNKNTWLVKISKSICLVDNNFGSTLLEFLISLSSYLKNKFLIKKISSFFTKDFFIQGDCGFFNSIFNSTRCFLISCDLRFEACILNLRTRVQKRLNNLIVYNIGNFVSNNILNVFYKF